jgi:nucleoid-associated protein YgaU
MAGSLLYPLSEDAAKGQCGSTQPREEENPMGLFDFVKTMGKKLFDNDAEAAEKIKAHIEQDNPGVNGLQVTYEGGVVSLSGEADSSEALEKAVLMAGNVKGVTEINVDGLEAPAVEGKIEYYTIVSGDTLSGLAKKFYGKAGEYPRIFEANREVIKDPDLIYVGQKIRIPMN